MKPKRGPVILILSSVTALLLVWAVASLVHGVRDWRWRHAGPIVNRPARIWDVRYPREFNDMNDTQLAVARVVGVPPVENRAAAEHLKKKLVELHDNDLYVIDSLTHSIPFLTPEAARLLGRIGRNFQDSLSAKGLNPNKIVVTSVLRTEEDVRRLRRGNINASENSTHRYGTTFDLSYWHYVKVEDLRGRPYESVPAEQLRAVLGQVIKDLHDEGACYVKYEKKQTCFHITSRK